MRIFKNKRFHRFANKEGIRDNELREVVKQLEKGQIYADLGGGVYKMQFYNEDNDTVNIEHISHAAV